MNWLPDEYGQYAKDGDYLLSVEGVKTRQYMWWLHYRGQCICHGTSPSMAQAKSACEEALKLHPLCQGEML